MIDKTNQRDLSSIIRIYIESLCKEVFHRVIHFFVFCVKISWIFLGYLQKPVATATVFLFTEVFEFVKMMQCVYVDILSVQIDLEL